MILAAPIVGVAVLATVTPSDHGVRICPFALCTGMACPGCGMTRAASMLLHGDVGRALAYHPLLPLIGAQIVVGWGWFLLWKMGFVSAIKTRTLNWALSVTALALVVTWVVRMASGTLPPV